MGIQDLILIDELCVHYKLELSFFDDLDNNGLIEIQVFEQQKFIHQDSISDLEKMIRLHHELHINLEGIDTIFNLLKRIGTLQDELISTKNRLRLYED
jgi:hypothetical protein